MQGVHWDPMPVDLVSELTAEQLDCCLGLLQHCQESFMQKLRKSVATQTEPVFCIDHGERFLIRHFWAEVRAELIASLLSIFTLATVYICLLHYFLLKQLQYTDMDGRRKYSGGEWGLFLTIIEVK